jgi:hypothetical protein
MSRFSSIVLLFLLSTLVLSEGAGATVESTGETHTVDDVVQACLDSPHQFAVCDMVLELQQFQNDTLSTLKRKIRIGAYETLIITAANAAATGKIRWRKPILMFPETYQIIDLQKDKVLFLLEKRF